MILNVEQAMRHANDLYCCFVLGDTDKQGHLPGILSARFAYDLHSHVTSYYASVH